MTSSSRTLALALFTKQLAVALNSGLPVQSALEVLGKSDDAFAKVVDGLLESISQGHRMSRALDGYPKVFSPLYRRLVQVGEQTGSFVTVFELLASWLERESKVSKKVVSALVYPLFVLGTTAIASILMAFTVLPSFLQVLEDLNAPLPLPSRILIALVKISLNPVSWLVAGGALGAWAFFFRQWLKSDDGRLSFEKAMRAVPVLGTLLRDLSLTRLFICLELSTRVGLDMRRSLLVSSAACGSLVVEEDFKYLLEAVQEGASVSEYMNGRKDLYPRNVSGLVNIGEETGKLAKIFGIIGRYYEDEVEHSVEIFIALLEPVLLGFVSVMAGGVMLALLLPLYNVLLSI
jgi:type IV pilus assembly protein PilC